MADKRATTYIEEFRLWKEQLRQYWTQLDKNQELYEFYKRDAEETESQVSLNTPFSIVESMIAKANETSLNITVRAKGENGLTTFEQWVSAVLKDAIDDTDVAKFYGTYRKNKEKFFRDFLVKGNAVASVEWCKQEGAGKVIANNPYIRNRNLKSVIFNPSRSLADSDVYYIESWVKYTDLEKDQYDKKSKKGLYSNLGDVKALAKDADKFIDAQDETFFSDGEKINRKLEPIHIVERWEGASYCVIADIGEEDGRQVTIREEEDPFQIGGNNLLIGMNYVVGDRPYAYGEIDAIYGIVRAQDTIINQNLDIINRYLRPGYINDPNSGIDSDQLIVLIENGGVLPGRANMISVLPSEVPPAQAFTTIDLIQQAIERTARYSPYSVGQTSQTTDKTQGTKGGIQSLQAAAEPNFQVKIDALQDQFDRPMAKFYLMMIANLMKSDDVRYGLLQGRTPRWVGITKNILQGRTSIQELLEAELISEELAQQYTVTTIRDAMPDGQVVERQVEIPGAAEAIMFDVDWLVDVKLDNQSAVDKQQKTIAKQAWVEWARTLGVQFNPIKTATEIGRELGIEDPEDLYAPEMMGQPGMQPGMPGQPGMGQEQAPGGMPQGMPGQMMDQGMGQGNIGVQTG